MLTTHDNPPPGREKGQDADVREAERANFTLAASLSISLNPQTLDTVHYTLNPKLETFNPKPQTLNPQPQTLNPTPGREEGQEADVREAERGRAAAQPPGEVHGVARRRPEGDGRASGHPAGAPGHAAPAQRGVAGPEARNPKP